MELFPILNETDYRKALAAVEPFFDNPPEDSDPRWAWVDAVVTLIEAYEAKTAPMPQPTALEAIEFVMDQRGLTPKDLVPAIGQLNRVYEVLNGKRKLSLAMIRRLNEQFDIPLESLIR